MGWGLAQWLLQHSGLPRGLRVPGRGRRGPRAQALPLLERPAHPARSRMLTVFLTGDGGCTPLVRRLAAHFNAAGVSMVAWNSRRYYARPRTRAEVTRDLARILRGYGDAWGMEQFLLVGYSRGADLLPFLVPRLPAALRARVLLVALLGPGPTINYHLRWEDLLRTVPRPEDLPTLPALARYAGPPPLLCVHGEREEESLCHALHAHPQQVLTLPGSHHYGYRFRPLAHALLQRAQAAARDGQGASMGGPGTA